MEEYRSNSHKAREDREKKKIDKVTRGPVKTKKKNEIQKLADVFISEDIENVRSYILMDVLVPAMKKAVSDIVTNGIDMILYGEAGRSKRGTSASKVSYRSYYDREKDRRGARNRTVYDYDDIILDSKGEAEEVLSRMDEMIDRYGVASVGDLYDLVGIDGSYTDNKYGWTDIRSARSVRVRDGGYLLKLPKPLPID